MITQENTTETVDSLSLAERQAFMKLPLEERRKRLAEQADQAAQYYESQIEKAERELWQGGDIVES